MILGTSSPSWICVWGIPVVHAAQPTFGHPDRSVAKGMVGEPISGGSVAVLSIPSLNGPLPCEPAWQCPCLNSPQQPRPDIIRLRQLLACDTARTIRLAAPGLWHPSGCCRMFWDLNLSIQRKTCISPYDELYRADKWPRLYHYARSRTLPVRSPRGTPTSVIDRACGGLRPSPAGHRLSPAASAAPVGHPSVCPSCRSGRTCTPCPWT